MKVGDVFIRSIGLVTGAGDAQGFFRALGEDRHFFVTRQYSWGPEWVAPLDSGIEYVLQKIRAERGLNEMLDRSVLMAVAAARQAWTGSGWSDGAGVGVLVGSSRGATESLERHFSNFLKNPDHRVDVFTSPTTTLGNISSSIAQDLLLQGPEVSFSITCSTALHSLVAALGWIRGDMCPRFLIGGSEAALSEFTLAQMKALRIYSNYGDVPYPSRPLGNHHPSHPKTTSFVLGEAAVILGIEGKATLGDAPALAEIAGVGWAIEPITTLTSVSTPGDVFFAAMARALEGLRPQEEVDAIVAHAPGTIIGDISELSAIERVFPQGRPTVYSPKWQFGHTFGASGGINLAAAIHLLQGGEMFVPPFQLDHGRERKEIRTVLVNGAGFGGNACSVLLRKV